MHKLLAMHVCTLRDVCMYTRVHTCTYSCVRMYEYEITLTNVLIQHERSNQVAPTTLKLPVGIALHHLYQSSVCCLSLYSLEINAYY